MIRTIRLVVGGLAAAGLLAACSNDVTSPNSAQGARFSGGSGGGGSATGGSATGGSTGGGSTGGGSTKTGCVNTMTLNGSATEALAGNTFSVAYLLNSCQSKTRVSMTATDLATGQVVWSSIPDLAGTIAIWTLPYKLTSYRIDARAVAGSANTLVATASTVLSTMNPLACDVFVHETATSGYWITYAAIWLATDVQTCGQSGRVHLKVTNMNSGSVELEYADVGTSSFIDFEGPIVSYNTPYRVLAELISPEGVVLATSTTDIMSAVLK